MTTAAGAKPLRLRIDFPATTIGGALLAQQLMPVAEPLFAEAPRVEAGRHVWVVELTDGVGIGAVIGGFDVMIRAEDGKVAVVLPAVVAGVVAARLMAAGAHVETTAEAAGAGVAVSLSGRTELPIPFVGSLALTNAM